MLSREWMASFWSTPMVEVNLVVFMNLAGALALGLIVGYERSYHGRAAGMRTYGIVCMASAALTVFVGYPAFWYGGHGGFANMALDPTRVVQGIVTGIGFLGAGVIMKEGLSITGLTTAASIWASSAIGVLVGVGLYGAAILLTALSTALMVLAPRIESNLPSRHAVGITLRFVAGRAPPESELVAWLRDCGYEMAPGSVSIQVESALTQWHFVALSIEQNHCMSLPRLASELGSRPGVALLDVVHARN